MKIIFKPIVKVTDSETRIRQIYVGYFLPLVLLSFSFKVTMASFPMEAMAEVERRAAALGIPTPEPMPTPEAGCQAEDDFCEPGCVYLFLGQKAI